MILAIFLGVIQALCLVGIVFSFFMLYRNKQVYAFRSWMLDEASRCAKIDINAGRDGLWRYAPLRAEDYHKMVKEFWRPLVPNEWYEDLSFIREGSDQPVLSNYQPAQQQ